MVSRPDQKIIKLLMIEVRVGRRPLHGVDHDLLLSNFKLMTV